MKKPEQIIILEDNDISMFVAQSLLAPFEEEYQIRYFKNVEDTMEFLKEISLTAGYSVCMFVNIGITLNNAEFIEVARKTIFLNSSRLFLLTSIPVEGEKKETL